VVPAPYVEGARENGRRWRRLVEEVKARMASEMEVAYGKKAALD
jgi:hypothetical protein